MATLLEVMLMLLIIFVITIPVIKHTVKIGLPRASNQPRNSSRSLNWTEVFNQETPSSCSWLAPSPWHAAWQIGRLNVAAIQPPLAERPMRRCGFNSRLVIVASSAGTVVRRLRASGRNWPTTAK
ncbi:hypothetical protein [Cupriavidus sp. CuC1]|uniref:hypothetical protein n=1 Tax=Cupriavidus sp. CuC1 TaxID=3373131 RepID=UPI0037D534CF